MSDARNTSTERAWAIGFVAAAIIALSATIYFLAVGSVGAAVGLGASTLALCAVATSLLRSPGAQHGASSR